MLTGLFFSFSQGAWISVLIAAATGLAIHFRAQWRVLLP